MIPSFHAVNLSRSRSAAAAAADQTLFKQYTKQLKSKEKAQRAERADAAARNRAGTYSLNASAASSTVTTPARSSAAGGSAAPSPGVGGEFPTSPWGAAPLTPGVPRTPGPGGNSAFASAVASPATPAPGGSVSSRVSSARARIRPPRLSHEEINARWKAIFAEMERWTAEEGAPISPPAAVAPAPTAARSSGSAVAAAAPHPHPHRTPCSYATAEAAERAYEAAMAQHARVLEGYAIQADQHRRLTEAARAQAAAGGPRKGERRFVAPAPLPLPPSPPPPPPASPYATAYILPEDRAWRATLAAHPEQLYGDALDHRALEARLLSFLNREGHPLTRVKDAFVTNFLDAYSAGRNSSLRGCTTSQASDLLLSNTLPTLLYFLDLLAKLLGRLWPELQQERNRDAAESVRQACMESVFPSIFPALFALYRRKYYFRDAELSSKMAVLASTGPGGCNITLADLGVSKWFCLDEKVVAEERAKAREKRRARERERLRREQGETEAQALDREQREDERARASEEAAAAAYDKQQESEAAAAAAEVKAEAAAAAAEAGAADSASGAADTDGVCPSSSGLATLESPPHIPRSSPHQTLQLLSPTQPHPISALTRSSDGADGGSGPASVSNGALASTPPAASGPGVAISPAKLVTPTRPGAAAGSSRLASSLSSSPSNKSPFRGAGTGAGAALGLGLGLGGGGGAGSPARAIPTTRLEPAMAGFEARSLSSSPRAEKLQDVFLSMSPSRRGVGAGIGVGVGVPIAANGSGGSGGTVPAVASSLSKSVRNRAGEGLHLSFAAAAPSSSLGKTSSAGDVLLQRQANQAQAHAASAAEPRGEGKGAGLPAEMHVVLSDLPGAEAAESASEALAALSMGDPLPQLQSQAQQPPPKTPDSSESSKRTLVQVGFAAPAAPAVGAEATLSPVQAAQPPSVTSSPAPGSSSSLALALQQRRTNNSANPSPAPAAKPLFVNVGLGSLNGDASAAASPPHTQPVRTPPKPTKLGLGLGATGGGGTRPQSIPGLSVYSDSDSDGEGGEADGSRSPSMPSMGGHMPVLGSSMPMLQGLPSSMMTHTPGSGSELLRREHAQKKRGGLGGGGSGTGSSSDIFASGNGHGASTGLNGHGHGRSNGASSPVSSSSRAGSTPQLQLAQHAPPQLMQHHNHNQQQQQAQALVPHAVSAVAHHDGDRSSNGTELASAAAAAEEAAGEEEEEETFPFQEAVVLLRRLSSERTPRDKLTCLIAVSVEICFCVDKFYAQRCFARRGWRPRPEDLCINADDLLSIVSFILIKSQVAHLFSEAAFIDDFISRPMKLHMPGYFLATLQAAIELIHKLDKAKFLTREMVERELRESAATAAAAADAASKAESERDRRPSYLQSHAPLPNTGLSSSLPRASSSQPIGTAAAVPGSLNGSGSGPRMLMGQLPPAAPLGLASSSQPRPGGLGIVHPQAVTLQAGPPAHSSRALSVSAQAQSGAPVGIRIGTPASSAQQQQHQPQQLHQQPQPQQPSSRMVPSSVAPSPAVTPQRRTRRPSDDEEHAMRPHRTATFHSSPASRLGSADPEASRPSAWQMAFEVKTEHFNVPSVSTPARSAPIKQLAQQAMGQTRGF